MTKRDLAIQIAEATGARRRDSRAFLNALLDIAREVIASGQVVTLPGLGTFEPYVHPARECLHPVTRAPMTVGPYRDVRFRASVTLKRLLRAAQREV